MKVEADYVCEHKMPRPWATCVECMSLPISERPEPPAIQPPPRPTPRGRLPQSATDGLPALVGDKDMSFPVHDFDAHMVGPDNGWLVTQGFPWDLRKGGWVYLRHEGQLGGRARVRGIGWREERKLHTGDPDGTWGPGATIELDASTWERFDHDLGALADDQRQGYRYLITDTFDQIHHLIAGEPVPETIAVSPPLLMTRDAWVSRAGAQRAEPAPPRPDSSDRGCSWWQRCLGRTSPR